ncbi:hypothetical protein MGAST_05790 [Mycobacterium gastri 'Wayne']|uniref:Uncharacterized protein n=1 Tax=Mycobacterium gastri TaxID=1777 RepID=A0A1X1W0Z0_MYCGS|nr:hypothetical protein MGAST_05790 [Mycobacterium gastri 'Wayne']ORV79477.1 hypothetical protein AWC07_22250 [Mycobacterium gastri]
MHAFSPAIDPPWETRSDYEAFGAIASAFSTLAAKHLGTRTDIVLGALAHDTPGAMAYPSGVEYNWRTVGERPKPGKTMGTIADRLAHLAEGSEERRITYADAQARPVPVITSPEWSGSETGRRRYAPFTVNIEELKPFHTLTGRRSISARRLAQWPPGTTARVGSRRTRRGARCGVARMKVENRRCRPC